MGHFPICFPEDISVTIVNSEQAEEVITAVKSESLNKNKVLISVKKKKKDKKCSNLFIVLEKQSANEQVHTFHEMERIPYSLVRKRPYFFLLFFGG